MHMYMLIIYTFFSEKHIDKYTVIYLFIILCLNQIFFIRNKQQRDLDHYIYGMFFVFMYIY